MNNNTSNLSALSNSIFLAFTFAVISVLPRVTLATAANVTATISVNEQLTIDLTPNITNVQVPSVTVTSQPADGTAIVGSGLTIVYTPSQNFIGAVSFDYDVYENQGGEPVLDSSATITVNVISSGTPTATTLTPQQSMNNYLNYICVQNTPSPAMVPLCNAYNNATAGERQVLIAELSPQEIAAQKQLSNIIAIEQLDNIRRRLAALRQGQKGVDLQNLSFNQNGSSFSAATLAAQWLEKGEGGAASADGQLGSKLGVFVGGNFGGGNHDTTTAEDGFDYSTYGLTGGADYRISDRLVFGGALGYSLNDMTIDSNGGNLDVNGMSLLAYGSYYRGTKMYVDAIVSFQTHNFDASRNINYTISQPSATAKSDTSSAMLTMSAGAGFEVFYRQGFTATILGNLDYLNSTIDGYQESNAGILNLSIAERDTEQLASSIGAQATYAFNLPWGVIIPQVDVSWKHEFIDDAETIRGTFISDGSGTVFEFNTDTPDNNYFKFGLGASAVWPGGTTGYFQLEKTLGKSYFSDFNLAAGVRIEL